MEINGFTFYALFNESGAKYYKAVRGEVVLTSKSLDYLIRKVKKHD